MVMGWLSGKAIKPIALRHVYEIASAVKVPVIGVGGIATRGGRHRNDDGRC